MKEIVGIKFEETEPLKYYLTENLPISKNQTVIAMTEKGLEFGTVVTDVHPIDTDKLKEELPQIIRVSTKRDYLNYKENKQAAKKALNKCKRLVKQYNLNMDIIDAFYTLDKDHLIFNFYSNDRVDFRELAKQLAYIYKTRIELRQIGVRDKAKKISGLGCCGQELCCSRFLTNFNSVSISMAKNQNLSLNPSKINGVCGRLLCCLRYENDCYSDCRKNLPKLGQEIETEQGTGKIISLDILNHKYKIELENGNIIEKEVNNGSN